MIAGGAKLNPPAVGLLSDVAEAPDPPKLNPAELPELEKLNVEVAGLDSVFAPANAERGAQNEKRRSAPRRATDDADDDAGAPNENDGALPAAPKPKAPPAPDDDAAGAAPKLNAPAAPALGAAGSSAGAFPAALSRSSWRAFCAALYPALALARNAALNPPALGAAGSGFSFSGSSLFSEGAIAGAAPKQTRPPAAPPAPTPAAGAAPNAGAAVDPVDGAGRGSRTGARGRRARRR